MKEISTPLKEDNILLYNTGCISHKATTLVLSTILLKMQCIQAVLVCVCVFTWSRKSMKQPWAFILSSSWWRMMSEVRGNPALSGRTGTETFV